jgi:hypothetical protein
MSSTHFVYGKHVTDGSGDPLVEALGKADRTLNSLTSVLRLSLNHCRFKLAKSVLAPRRPIDFLGQCWIHQLINLEYQ